MGTVMRNGLLIRFLSWSPAMRMEMMMKSKQEAVELATQFVREGFLCSESVLMSLSRSLDVSSDVIPRIATGFGAGIGRHGEVCGALAGGVMALGLKYGRSVIDAAPAERRPYWFAAELLTRFRSEFGAVRCRDLLGVDISSEEGLRAYREEKLWDTRCRRIIVATTELAHDILRSKS